MASAAGRPDAMSNFLGTRHKSGISRGACDTEKRRQVIGGGDIEDHRHKPGGSLQPLQHGRIDCVHRGRAIALDIEVKLVGVQPLVFLNGTTFDSFSLSTLTAAPVTTLSPVCFSISSRA